jgi:CRP-like cAMP-binding protein
MHFLDSLGPAERQAFTTVADERTFPRGATIMREGEQAHYVMVILSGWTRITVQGAGGERMVAERGPGQLVGERGALRLQVRSATVTALDTIRALVMKTADFASFVSAHPSVLDFVENLIDSYPAVETSDEEDHPARAVRLPITQQPSAVSRRLRLAGENCTVLLTDVVGFSGSHRNDRDRRVVRRSALEMMRTSLGVIWDECIPEDRGDGQLIVVPPTIPTARVVERLHRELPGELRLHNHTYGEPARIQLRVAINVGPVTGDAFGMEGDTINRTARLIEAPMIKQAMASTGASLGIIASTFVYETAIRDEELAHLAEYKMTRVKVKEYTALAWLRLIDQALPPARDGLALLRDGAEGANPSKDVLGRAAHAGRYLDGRPHPKQQLRARAASRPTGQVASPVKLERLAVQGGRDAPGGVGEQDALQRLSGIDPVPCSVRVGRQDADHPGGPARHGAQWRQAPAAAMGEVPAGEVRERALGVRRVGGVRHPVSPGAAGRGRPRRELADMRAVKFQGMLRRLDDFGERGTDTLVGNDGQYRAVPAGAFPQHLEQFRGQRQRVEPASVRTPLPHLGEQPAFIPGGSRAVPPAEPGDEQRPGRVGQDFSLGSVTGRPQRQPGGKQRRAAADQHLAATGVGDSQLPGRVGVQAESGGVRAEPPGLGVVHRRSPDRLACDVRGGFRCCLLPPGGRPGGPQETVHGSHRPRGHLSRHLPS